MEASANGAPFGQAVEIGDAVAQQSCDGLASALVQRTAMDAACGCKPTRTDRLMPCARTLGVLEQPVGKCADRAGPQSNHDVGGVVGEALEIAVQRSVRRCPRQRIMCLCEVIEADRPVACLRQPVMRQRRLDEACRRVGESPGVDAALGLDGLDQRRA